MKQIVVFLLYLCVAGSVYSKTEKVMVRGAVGNLSAIIETPELQVGKRCPAVILMHGFGDNKNSPLLVLIAKKLDSLGIASIRFDFDAHGESEGAFQQMTVPREVEDGLDVYEYVKGLNRFGTIALLGHSQGGVVASMVAGRLGSKKIGDVVLLAPAAVLRDDAIRGNTMGSVYDPLNPPEFVQLPNGLKLGREYILTAFRLSIYETAAKYHGPACIIHGTADRIVPYTYGERYHEIWKKSSFFLLEGFDHGFWQNMNRAADIAVADLSKKIWH